jgi:hypothetical protein
MLMRLSVRETILQKLFQVYNEIEEIRNPTWMVFDSGLWVHSGSCIRDSAKLW